MLRISCVYPSKFLVKHGFSNRVKSKMEKFSCQYRAYLEDTDAGGIVYHANHIRFFDRARTEWLRERDLVEMRKQFNIHFVIRHIDIKYKRPLCIDDMLTITAQVHTLTESNFIAEQNIIVRGKVCATAKIDITLINGDTMRPVRIPPELYAELLKDKELQDDSETATDAVAKVAEPAHA